jgi:3-oxoacyl-[acyl-carrier protein] reductase
LRLLDAKVAILTGSGRGIGRAAAELFARHGARVVVNDVDEGPAQEAAAAIRAAGGEAAVCAGDVTAPDFPDRLLRAAFDSFGRLDIVVNNAGYTWDGVIHKMSDQQYDAMLDVHLKTPFRLLRALAPYWREAAKTEIAASGRAAPRKIINVSSTSGVAGNAGQINYAAAKMGVIGLTKTVAKEWGQFNITCNAVAYGWIDTRLTQAKEKGEQTAGGVPLGIPESQRAALAAHVPLGRAGTPEEAAGPMLFLASPLADYVTGAVILVTGGMYV